MPTTARAEQSNSHHDLPIHESVLLLQTDPNAGSASTRRASEKPPSGPNALPQTRPTGPLLRLLRQLHHPLIYVLLVAGAVTLLLGEHVDSAVIFGVVFVNMIVGFVQESRAEAALDALRAMVRTEAKVVRDGVSRTVPSERLVPGDLVLVEAGDRVPADLRLVRLSELAADESALTGESEPVVKDEVVLPPATPVADRRNMLHSGTLVTSGSGAGIAVATGAETELGEIHRLVGTAEVLQTPLTRKLAWFSKVLTVVILFLAAITFAIGVVRGESGVEMFTAAVALAVGAIPEGLPAAVTITLAIGVSRMARRRVVIRRLPAVETLGSTTVICSDKTGTLTENQMTVSRVWTPQGGYEITGAGYSARGDIVDSAGEVLRPDTMPSALRWTLLAGASCNDAALHHDADTTTVVGDPTEAAMLVAARKAGLVDVPPRTDTIPFSSQRQYMATLHTPEPTRPNQHGHVVFVKGAVERVLALCGAELGPTGPRPLEQAAALRAAENLASQGLRVLATAVAEDVPAERFSEEALAGSLVFTGLQAMFDPPRPAAASAVRSCREAGIAVKMITGDHAATATAIAGRIDLLDGSADGKVLTGAELAEISEERLPDAVREASVFARVSPEQKLRLVEAMQSRSEVVAMTGDGVNDAPALRQADIGVAMGRGGTEVAKEAGDMVLTDDDFATIEAAVEEGRGVFDNLTKFIVWTLPTNMAEGLVILVAIFVGTALPILPTQILWINMTTAVALGLMLAFEPKERGIMRRPPRDPRRPLLTGGLVARVLLVSALLVGGSWWMFQWELAIGAGLPEARTVALNLFVAVELFYLFSCRSLTRSVWRIGWFSNKWVLGGVTFQIMGQAALTYLPVMQGLFDTAPIGLESWLRILGVAALASVVVGVHKRLFPQVL